MECISIDVLESLFRQKLEHMAFPGDGRAGNEARLVLGFWSYNEQRVERGAGIGWVRQQWQRQRQAEPTVILGFELRESILCGKEASLFDNGAIVYVPLPASLAEIQAAIDRVLGSDAGKLDQESSRRNAGEYWKRLFAWHHNFKGAVMANILATGEKLFSGQPDKTRRLEYKVLAGYRKDLIKDRLVGTRDREGLSALCDDVLVIGDGGLSESLRHAMKTLKGAAKTWENAYDTLQQEYTDERADTVCVDLGELRSMFEVIDRNVLDALEVTKRLAGEEATDGR